MVLLSSSSSCMDSNVDLAWIGLYMGIIQAGCCLRVALLCCAVLCCAVLCHHAVSPPLLLNLWLLHLPLSFFLTLVGKHSFILIVHRAFGQELIRPDQLLRGNPGGAVNPR